MNAIQQNWIKCNTCLRTDHRELKETSELTMEDAGYHQSNLFNDIVSHMYGLTFITHPRSQPIT